MASRKQLTQSDHLTSCTQFDSIVLCRCREGLFCTLKRRRVVNFGPDRLSNEANYSPGISERKKTMCKLIPKSAFASVPCCSSYIRSICREKMTSNTQVKMQGNVATLSRFQTNATFNHAQTDDISSCKT